ncbi:SPOR domain-containing protein [Thorsellia anophelis]|uniref:DedD protein n=1 Tax=Thorsellia anophelis DSM 18579 TaxID=1123402 RepID=A0A1H9YTI7_9GAMM|nr:SPOR domain-containing protein [Thorsellia anophelis]SES72400.1 DedD protein [Thorsellia anophelis DSM 18579]
MASKFQKQLVGSIILVGISVAVLPSLFDGKKWYNGQNQPAIALYPQNQNHTDQTYIEAPQINGQNIQLSNELPEHYSVPNNNLNEQNEIANTTDETAIIDTTAQVQGLIPLTTASNANIPNTQPKELNTTTPKQVATNIEKPVEKPAEQTKAKPVDTKSSQASGKYAVQLAALSNSTRANELVSKLQAAGYPAFTVSGAKLTRVYVGPNDSKQALNQQLGKLKSLTGLDGQVVTLK